MTYWIIVMMMLVAIVAVVLAVSKERDSGLPETSDLHEGDKERITDADA